jgi:hypothetical protein
MTVGVWDEARAGHVAAGSFGETLDATISSRLAPDTAGRTVSVTAGGTVGVNLADTEGQLATGSFASGLIGEIVDAILDVAVEGSRTLAQTLRGLWSFGLTKASGFNASPIVLRDAADTKNRITIAHNSTGRTSVTINDLD